MMAPAADPPFRETCYLIVVVAPSTVDWGESNLRINEFLDTPGLGVVVNHDHFRDDGANGGYMLVHVRTEEELAKLREPGPLEGWQRQEYPLWASVTATGFLSQSRFTMMRFSRESPERLAAQETHDERLWYREGTVEDWVKFAYTEDERWAGHYGWYKGEPAAVTANRGDASGDSSEA
jgi:hypothetical protein